MPKFKQHHDTITEQVTIAEPVKSGDEPKAILKVAEYLGLYPHDLEQLKDKKYSQVRKRLKDAGLTVKRLKSQHFRLATELMNDKRDAYLEERILDNEDQLAYIPKCRLVTVIPGHQVLDPELNPDHLARVVIPQVSDPLKPPKVERTKEEKVDKPKVKRGVIAYIVKLLSKATPKNPITKEEILDELRFEFPDRDPDSMTTTINIQIRNIEKHHQPMDNKEHEEKIYLGSDEDGYWLE